MLLHNQALTELCGSKKTRNRTKGDDRTEGSHDCETKSRYKTYWFARGALHLILMHGAGAWHVKQEGDATNLETAYYTNGWGR